MAKKIFVSYRRSEAEYAAGRLADDLRENVCDETVFRDKEGISGGEQWMQRIRSQLTADSIMLVLIGPSWASAAGSDGHARILAEDDPVRMEVRTALEMKAHLIPVLLENAALPSSANLPLDLQPMLQINALKLRDTDWAYDFAGLMRVLDNSGIALKRKIWSKKAWLALALLVLVALVTAEDHGADVWLAAMIASSFATVLGLWGWWDTREDRLRGRGLALSLSLAGALIVCGSAFNYMENSGDLPSEAAASTGPGPAPKVAATAAHAATSSNVSKMASPSVAQPMPVGSAPAKSAVMVVAKGSDPSRVPSPSSGARIQDVCGPRNPVSTAICEQRECTKAQYFNDSICMQLRLRDAERAQVGG